MADLGTPAKLLLQGMKLSTVQAQCPDVVIRAHHTIGPGHHEDAYKIVEKGIANPRSLVINKSSIVVFQQLRDVVVELL